ncbi:MAG: mycothiol synthase, partial [Acidimicrobiia bacterium]
MSLPVEAVLPSRADETRLRAIDRAVQDASGHEAFPEAVWAAIADPTRHPIVAIDSDGRAATVAFASDSFTPAHDQLAVGALPGTDVARIAATIDGVVHARGADHELVAWIPGSDPNVIETLTVNNGFAVDRRQFQLDIVLPIAETARWPEGVTVRSFVPGRDGTAWLRVNNRAFANHPDQGGWIAEVLERRQAEPWFDPAGFLLAWRDDVLVGFCWTKVHTEPTPQGEIYVIGVDPDAQGLGLGRALVIAGLEYLAGERQCETGILYVAADN